MFLIILHLALLTSFLHQNPTFTYNKSPTKILDPLLAICTLESVLFCIRAKKTLDPSRVFLWRKIQFSKIPKKISASKKSNFKIFHNFEIRNLKFPSENSKSKIPSKFSKFTISFKISKIKLSLSLSLKNNFHIFLKIKSSKYHSNFQIQFSK